MTRAWLIAVALVGLAGCDPGIGASGTVTVDDVVAARWPNHTVHVFLGEKETSGEWHVWVDLGQGPVEARRIDFRDGAIGCTRAPAQVVAWIPAHGGGGIEKHREVRIAPGDPFVASAPLPFERGLLRRCYAGQANDVQLTLRAP